MRHVDRGQRGEGQEAAVAVAAERAAQFEGVVEAHRRPPASLAGREVAAREHRVVRADPAAERDLHQRQRGDRPEAPAQRRRNRQAARLVGLGLDREQHEKAEPADQVQRDDCRVEPHRHRERAERALRHDPGERRERPRRRGVDAAAAPLDDGERGEDDHENADRRGGVAVRHLDPRLPVRDRAGGQRRLGPLDVRARAEGTGVAVAARPVGTAEARVAEPGEGAEQDQVEGEEEHEQREGAQPRRRRGTAPTRPEPGERRQREREAERGDAEERREVVARGRVVHRPARSQPAEARSSLSTSRFSFAGSASGGTRIIQSPRGSTR